MTSLGLKGIKTLHDIEWKDKKVFLRVDFNVPMKNGQITDNTRIAAALPTIKFLQEKGAKLILASHLGRPKTEADHAKFSLEPVGAELGKLLAADVILVESPSSESPKALFPSLRPGQVILLENLRFDAREEGNGNDLAKIWASYCDAYVNDAFGSSHRAHASIAALPDAMPVKAIGLLFQQEIEQLDSLIHEPPQPYYLILGGAKVSDKVGVIQHLLDMVSGIIVGGAMAYTFLAAKGVAVGNSLVEKDKLHFVRELIQRMETRKKLLLLPQDHIIVKSLSQPNPYEITPTSSIPDGWLGVDIGPKTRQSIVAQLRGAQTIFWNGPMGIFETPPFHEGTMSVAKALSQLKESKIIVGGGDSVAAVNGMHLQEPIGHLSTGGGASLEYIEGRELPGIVHLRVGKT